MHIPSEVLLIFFRHCGIQPRKWYSSFSDTEVQSCSRCGVCIDVCQMNDAGIHDAQAVYFVRGMRDRFVPAEIAKKCLVCGRCQEACPVGIQIDALHLIKRRELGSGFTTDFRYLPKVNTRFGEVVYFSGCMSHLTPSIIRSMKGLLDQAGLSWVHLDEDRSVCCGRPMMIAGKDRQASELIEHNKNLIRMTRAKVLVTSCPICYRVFREEYNLPIRIMHHSQFLLELVKTGKIPLQGNFRKVAYHDPCDLGRGSEVYEAPRVLLQKVADFVPVSSEAADARCCGGSLGMFTATEKQRDAITKGALDVLLENDPEILATACPLCKKTFAKHSPVKVLDLAELLYDAMVKPSGSVSAHSHRG
jgi:Fe-S oxidoreductase